VLDYPRRLDVVRQIISHLSIVPYFREPLSTDVSMVDTLLLKETLLAAIKELDFGFFAKKTRSDMFPKKRVNLPNFDENDLV
jgi:hypothetical protein